MKGKNGDRRLVGKRERRGFAEPNAIDSHRLGDIFKLLLAHVADVDRELALDLLIGLVRKADRTRLRQRLDASGNIDAVAVNFASVNNDVADVDADAEFDPALFRDDRVTLGHLLLYLDGALGCIDRARKFDEHGI